MKLKLLVGVLVFLIVVNLAAVGTFIYFHHFDTIDRTQDFPRFHRDRRAHVPRLTHEDREKLRGLLMEFHDETADLRERLRGLEGELFDTVQDEPRASAKADSLLREITEIRFELSRKAIEKLAATDFLSPTQRRMFFDAILMTGRGAGAPPHSMRDRRRPVDEDRGKDQD